MQKGQFLKYIVISVSLALFINALIPFYAKYNPPTAQTELSSIFGDKVLICTKNGFEWVSINDFASGKAIPEQHEDIQCALCYMSAAAKYFPPVQEKQLFAIKQQYIFALLENITIATNYRQFIPPSRAPPLS